ncbi:hypothetical protein [Micromonospora sp. NPDC049282]
MSAFAGARWAGRDDASRHRCRSALERAIPVIAAACRVVVPVLVSYR